MLTFLLSKTFFTVFLLVALGGVCGVMYLKWKWKREGAKEAEASMRNQAQEQTLNADKDLAKSNAISATESTSSKFKWLRKHANIEN